MKTYAGNGITVSAKDIDSAQRKIEKITGYYCESVVAIEADLLPACGCGWDGKVAIGAHGQTCPNCGTPLN